MPHFKTSIIRLLIGLWVLFLALPAGAYTVVEVEKTCPICGTVFTTTMGASGTQFGVRLDGKPLGATGAPWPVAVCPKDHFVFFKEGFAPEEIKRLKPYIQSAAYQKETRGNTSYFLMARIFQFLDEPPQKIAHTFFKLSRNSKKTILTRPSK